MFGVALALARLVRVITGWFGPVESEFGHFEGRVVTTWAADGRTMELIEDFAYVDHRGKRWFAPKGTLLDGATIPRVFWSVTGGPFEGRFRNASVVHDVYCVRKSEPSWAVHRMFYEACRCGGVPERKAKVMYLAVAKFGPQWRSMAPLLGELPIRPPKATENDVKAVVELFAGRNPSLDEIDAELV